MTLMIVKAFGLLVGCASLVMAVMIAAALAGALVSHLLYGED